MLRNSGGRDLGFLRQWFLILSTFHSVKMPFALVFFSLPASLCNLSRQSRYVLLPPSKTQRHKKAVNRRSSLHFRYLWYGSAALDARSIDYVGFEIIFEKHDFREAFRSSFQGLFGALTLQKQRGRVDALPKGSKVRPHKH